MYSTEVNSIAILTCWFGPYPWYFPYFLHSCSFNKTVDFIIITDNSDLNYEQPVNVKIIQKTLDVLNHEASTKLQLKVAIRNPYKLCDFKPAFGFIFSDLIKGYNFWGHSDLDIICGDLRGFLNNDLLARYDFISLRHDYVTGCFALYRNNSKMNEFFRRSRDYQRIFSSDEFFSFTECNFQWQALAEGKSILDVSTEIESFTYLIKSAHRDSEISAHFDFILLEGRTGRVVFDRGRILFKQKIEAVLYHLFWLKKYYKSANRTKIPENYQISPTRIYHRMIKKT